MVGSRARAAIDGLAGGLPVAPELEKGYPNQFCLPKNWCHYQLTGHNSLPKTGHNGFEHTRQGNRGFLPLLAGADATSL